MKINNKILYLLFSMLFVALIISLSVIYILFIKLPTINQIFDNSLFSIVELKSQTNDSLISYGSAIFIEDDGTLVSNAHVVTYKQLGVYKEFESFEIRFSFENEYREVSLIKYDLSQDIAILKLKNTENAKYKSIKYGDSSKILSGDKVYAIGNGMNHGIGINEGIISLPQVNIEHEDNIRNVIQCDLIINDGNSGGALLDNRGRLIGITTFRLKDNSGNIIYGIAFCIPISEVIDYLIQWNIFLKNWKMLQELIAWGFF